MSEERTTTTQAPRLILPWNDPVDDTGKRCSTSSYLKEIVKKDPEFAENWIKEELKSRERIARKKAKLWPGISQSSHQTTLNVCVHFHILLADPTSLTDAHLREQIDLLNADFSKQNADVPARWANRAADSGIQFSWDSDNRTNVSTTTYFPYGDDVKTSALGGSDPVEPDSRMQIWICNIQGNILGFGSYPGGGVQGVVIGRPYMGGDVPGLHPTFNKGRTLTHEAGHFLNLYHIWGEGGCGEGLLDDLLADTPNQLDSSPSTLPCPNVSKDTCPNHPDPDMWENYMDYTPDGCMGLFTSDQVNRMRDCLLNQRSDLLEGCSIAPPPPGCGAEGSPDCVTASWYHHHNHAPEDCDCDPANPPTGCPNGAGCDCCDATGTFGQDFVIGHWDSHTHPLDPHVLYDGLGSNLGSVQGNTHQIDLRVCPGWVEVGDVLCVSWDGGIGGGTVADSTTSTSHQYTVTVISPMFPPPLGIIAGGAQELGFILTEGYPMPATDGLNPGEVPEISVCKGECAEPICYPCVNSEPKQLGCVSVTRPQGTGLLQHEQDIIDACNALYQVAGDPLTDTVNPLVPWECGWACGISCEAVHNADPTADQDCCGNPCHNTEVKAYRIEICAEGNTCGGPNDCVYTQCSNRLYTDVAGNVPDYSNYTLIDLQVGDVVSVSGTCDMGSGCGCRDCCFEVIEEIEFNEQGGVWRVAKDCETCICMGADFPGDNGDGDCEGCDPANECCENVFEGYFCHEDQWPHTSLAASVDPGSGRMSIPLEDSSWVEVGMILTINGQPGTLDANGIPISGGSQITVTEIENNVIYVDGGLWDVPLGPTIVHHHDIGSPVVAIGRWFVGWLGHTPPQSENPCVPNLLSCDWEQSTAAPPTGWFGLCRNTVMLTNGECCHAIGAPAGSQGLNWYGFMLPAMPHQANGYDADCPTGDCPVPTTPPPTTAPPTTGPPILPPEHPGVGCDLPCADLDLYVKEGGSETVYFGNTTEGALSLNHDAHPGCDMIPLAPEKITGDYAEGKTWEVWWNQFSNCAPEWPEHCSGRSWVITNNGTCPLKAYISGVLVATVPPGDSVEIDPAEMEYAGYATGSQNDFNGGTPYSVVCDCATTTPLPPEECCEGDESASAAGSLGPWNGNLTYSIADIVCYQDKFYLCNGEFDCLGSCGPPVSTGNLDPCGWEMVHECEACPCPPAFGWLYSNFPPGQGQKSGWQVGDTINCQSYTNGCKDSRNVANGVEYGLDGSSGDYVDPIIPGGGYDGCWRVVNATLANQVGGNCDPSIPQSGCQVNGPDGVPGGPTDWWWVSPNLCPSTVWEWMPNCTGCPCPDPDPDPDPEDCCGPEPTNCELQHCIDRDLDDITSCGHYQAVICHTEWGGFEWQVGSLVEFAQGAATDAQIMAAGAEIELLGPGPTVFAVYVKEICRHGGPAGQFSAVGPTTCDGGTTTTTTTTTTAAGICYPCVNSEPKQLGCVNHPCALAACEQDIIDACNALYEVAGDPSTISVNPNTPEGWSNGISCEAVHNADPNTDQDCCGNACVSATTTTTACPNPPCCPSEYEGNPCLGGNAVKFLGVFGEGCWSGESVVINGVTSENYETIRLSDGTCISSWVPIDGFSGETKTVDEIWAGHTCDVLSDPEEYGGNAALVDCPAAGGGGGGGLGGAWRCSPSTASPSGFVCQALQSGPPGGCWDSFPTQQHCEACCPCSGAVDPQNCTPATQPPRISGLWEGLS